MSGHSSRPPAGWRVRQTVPLRRNGPLAGEEAGAFSADGSAGNRDCGSHPVFRGTSEKSIYVPMQGCSHRERHAPSLLAAVDNLHPCHLLELRRGDRPP